MTWWQRWWRREELDRQLDVELADHLERLTADYVAGGMDEGEARRRARIDFGGLQQVREASRETWGASVMDGWLQDVGYATRSLRRSAGFTGVTLLILAIGLGATTAIFSVIHSVLLAPFPYPDPERVVEIFERWPRLPGGRPVSMRNYVDWAEQNTVFESSAAVSWGSVTVGDGDHPIYVNGSFVSASYFDVFGMHAAVGRTFDARADGLDHGRVVVLSHRLWTSRFGGDPALVGTAIRLDGEPYTVIGVMPAGTSVDFLDPQLWRLLTFENLPPRGSRGLQRAVARLKRGATLAEARTDMDVIASRLARAYPESNQGYGVLVEPYPHPVGLNVEASLYVLLAAVAAVLIVGCVNVAGLGLGRSAMRARELAIRRALGANRARLVRQLLTEQLLIAVGGGLSGILVAYGVVEAIRGLVPTTGLRAAFTLDTSLAIEWSVWAFAFALAVISGTACGLVPAIRSTRHDLTPLTAKSGQPGFRGPTRPLRLRGLLVLAQVALSFVLLTSAVLLAEGFFRLSQRAAAGFDSTNVLTAGLPTPLTRFESAAAYNAHLDELSRRIHALPGVRQVAFSDSLPTEGAPYLTRFLVSGQEPRPLLRRQLGGLKVVSPSYLRTVGLRLIRGRFLTDRDREDAPFVVVINATLARTQFQGDPIGRQMLMRRIPFGTGASAAGPGRPILETPDITWTVVGVVADEGVSLFDERIADPTVYVTHEQHPRRNLALLVQTAGERESVAAELRRTVASFDRDQALADLKPLDELKREDLAPDRLRSLLLALFAGVALLMAAIGLYGIVAMSVVQRTREIGIRAALGATGRSLRVLIARQTMPIVAAGLAVGLAMALLATRVLEGFLYGTTPVDPFAFGTALVALLGVALLATYVPARRASRIEPVLALRHETE